MTDDDEVSSEAPGAPARSPTWVRALALAAVGLSFVAAQTMYAAVGLAAVVIVAAFILGRRGVKVRGLVFAGISSVLIAGGSTYACAELVPAESELSGKERVDHERDGDSFERAFDEATRAPGGGEEP